MTTRSKPIVSESDTAKIEEPKEHTTGHKSAVQDMQEDKTLSLQDTIHRYNTYIFFLIR
ncbi:MAG TPA: hypothetical protein VFS97_03240 [Nitrososphaeraceae archaeon]|nr:hypothetical protein [Nitrososphaeraceae archaeon]